MMMIMVPYSPKDVGITVDFGGPFRLAAVAFPVVGCHDWVAVCCCSSCRCCLGEWVVYFFEREKETFGIE